MNKSPLNEKQHSWKIKNKKESNMDNKLNLRSHVRGCYDFQLLRIQIGNRLVSNFRSKLGYKPSDKNTSDSDANKVLGEIKQSYKRLTDGIANIKNLKYDSVISNIAEYGLVSQYFDLKSKEEEQFKLLEKILDIFPIHSQFLKKVKGVGVKMSGVIVSEIDIYKSKYVSSLWKYAGLDVKNGIGRSRKKESLEEKEYIDKNGEVKTKIGITYNPFLKTKLIGVLGGSFLKSKSEYANIYYDYRNRLENSDKHKDKTKLHKHNMANRYMIKMFLKDLYVVWREMEGLTVNKSYQEEKLKHEH